VQRWASSISCARAVATLEPSDTACRRKRLISSEVVHSSRPKAYLKLEADELIGGALRVERGTFLFGRRNTLFDPQMQPLAEIVEILPPAAAGSLQS
jgi:hypothetical protein